MATQALAHREQTGVATRQPTEYDRLRHGLEKRASDFAMALPAGITPEKFQRVVMTAAQSNPDLLKADRATLITACMKAAQDGLLPDGREAALVVYNTRKKQGNQWVSVPEVQYLPMVYGLRKKILQSGEISSIETSVVYRRELEEGHFIFEGGTEAMLRHRPMLDLSDDDVTDDNIIAAYSVATMKDGTKSFEVMRRVEINKVRQASQTGAEGRVYQYGPKKGEPIPPKGPWVDWFSEMARKTVMRRHAKTLPMSSDLIDIEAHDEAIAARSATALLGSEENAAPRALPSRDDVGDDFDPETGEVIEHDGRSEEEVARDLDRQGFAEMEGRTDDDSGAAEDQPKQAAKGKRAAKPKAQDAPADGSEGEGEGEADEANEPHPGTALADEMVQRLEQADVLGTAIGIESEFAKHAAAMLDGDVERVKIAIANTKKRFGK